MIRINLLGTAKPKNKRGSAAVTAPTIEFGEVGAPKVKVLVAVMGAVAFNGIYWYRLDKEAQDTAAKMKVAEQQNQADNYKRRVDVIDQLRAAQSGPANLLNTIGDTVHGTEAVWLNSMKD